jgi:twitching motility two-component system response regulator PilH
MKKKVLIVDFDPASIEELKNILNHPIFEVTSANDGEKARKLLTKEEFDLVISEVILPRIHGFTLNQWLAENCRDTKRIIVSGVYKGESYRERALTEGKGDDYFEKPLNRSKFKDSISLLLALDIWEKPVSDVRFQAEAAAKSPVQPIEAETKSVQAEEEPEITIEIEEKEPKLTESFKPREKPAVRDRYKKIDSEISKKFEDTLADLGLKK